MLVSKTNESPYSRQHDKRKRPNRSETDALGTNSRNYCRQRASNGHKKIASFADNPARQLHFGAASRELANWVLDWHRAISA
jgi:hypothetical protein